MTQISRSSEAGILRFSVPKISLILLLLAAVIYWVVTYQPGPYSRASELVIGSLAGKIFIAGTFGMGFAAYLIKLVQALRGMPAVEAQPDMISMLGLLNSKHLSGRWTFSTAAAGAGFVTVYDEADRAFVLPGFLMRGGTRRLVKVLNAAQTGSA